MKTFFFLSALTLCSVTPCWAVDLYGATPTAQSLALGGIYFGSLGPTDSLASNPAGLTFTGRPELEITGLGVLSGGQYRNSTSYPGTLDSGTGLSGSFGFAARVPGTRLSLGVGVFPTALLSGKWKYMDPPGTAGVSYGLQTSKSAFLAFQSSVGAGYQVSHWLSVGAGLGIVYNINTLETPYIFQTNPTLAGLKALLDLHTNGVGYNGTFGVILEPTNKLQLGLTYKTRTTVRSFGTATGSTSELFAALGVASNPNYRYKAEVDNIFPQSASIALGWQAQRYLHLYLQSDWLNWHNAFVNLPVHFTDGNNVVLNSLLASTSLNDSIPLHWRNQLAIRTGFSIPIGELATIMGGYAHENDPVPASTLTPLTAAITSNSLSTGIARQQGRYRMQLSYQVNPPATVNVGVSQILAGEYDHTRTRLWLQTLALSTAVRF